MSPDLPDLPELERRESRNGIAVSWRSVLNWAFIAFNSIRVVTYLPTMWAIYSSGDSSQHSLFTWLAWVGLNATMAAWLYENGGRRINKAIVTTCGNATMCLVTSVLVLIYR